MLAQKFSLKKAFFLSLILHLAMTVFFSVAWRQQAKIHYWVTTPVELVSVPAAENNEKIVESSPSPETFKKEEIKEEKIKKEVSKKVKEKAPPKKIIETKEPIKAKEPTKKISATPVKTEPAKPIIAAANTKVETVAKVNSTVVPDVKDFPYLYYLNIIQKKVSSNWNAKQAEAVNQKVTVHFNINKEGQVEDVKIAESSGVSFLDHSAMRAVLLSNPFPPLPAEYQGNYLGVNFGFEYKSEGK